MKRTKTVLSIFVILSIVVCSIFTCTMSVSADNTITYDWQNMGVFKFGSTKNEEDYNSEGVVNLRCNYSSWDSSEEYLWLISNWDVTHEPSSLYLGSNYDMSQITSIAFDYITNKEGDLSNNRVSFTKDAAGTQVVARAQITEHTTENLKNPKSMQMEIIDSTYQGDIYLYIEYQTKMFVGNLKIEGTDSLNPQLPGIAGQPEKTMVPSATWDPKKEFVRNESGYEMLEMSLPTMIIICSAIFVVMAVSIVLIWTVKKKKPAEQ